MPKKTQKNMTVNLTEMFIRKIKPTGKRFQYTDGKCPGLKLRVGATGRLTFAAMLRDQEGKYNTHTIGTHPEIGLKLARETTNQLRGNTSFLGLANPTSPVATQISEITFREILDEAQVKFGKKLKSWRPRGGPKSTPHAQHNRTCVRFAAGQTDRNLDRRRLRRGRKLIHTHSSAERQIHREWPSIPFNVISGSCAGLGSASWPQVREDRRRSSRSVECCPVAACPRPRER